MRFMGVGHGTVLLLALVLCCLTSLQKTAEAAIRTARKKAQRTGGAGGYMDAGVARFGGMPHPGEQPNAAVWGA